MRATHTQTVAHDALAGGLRRTQKQMIMDLFDAPKLALTRQEIADRTNLRLSSVCGRVRELLDDEALKVCGTRECVATGVQNEIVGLPVEVAA